jgi:hypothetical protein
VSSYRPQARRDGLLIRSLADELVVYDLKSFRAACLNRSAAAVWQRCDGKHSVEMIAQDVTDQLGEPFGADAVWCALDGLASRSLLEPAPPDTARPTRTRREWLRTLSAAGLSGALLPTIASVLAPSAAEAATQVSWQDCLMMTPPNCGNADCVRPNGMAGMCQSFFGLFCACF